MMVLVLVAKAGGVTTASSFLNFLPAYGVDTSLILNSAVFPILIYHTN